MDILELKLKIMKETEYVITKYNNILEEDVLDYNNIEFDWDLSGVVAGRADVKRKILKINLILAKENFEDYLTQTLPHEIVHLIQSIKYPKAKQWHGKEFRYLLRIGGYREETYHDYDISSVVKETKKNNLYKCSCRNHYLSNYQCNKIRAGYPLYCKICGSILTEDIEIF